MTRIKMALLDTTIQLDRKKMPNRERQLDSILGEYALCFSTSICLLEFKATLINECITIHNNLRLKKRFTIVRDALVEKKYRQTSLRSHIFSNIIQVFPDPAREFTDRYDEQLAERARLSLENIIPRLYSWFRKSVDTVLDDLRCDRSQMPPEKKTVSFAVNLPKCIRGQNKFCRVEAVVRRNATRLVEHLEATKDQSEQFQRALPVVTSLRDNADLELSHAECRRLGDCLIALQGESHATHAISTNAREWKPLSDFFGFDFVCPRYSGEETR